MFVCVVLVFVFVHPKPKLELELVLVFFPLLVRIQVFSRRRVDVYDGGKRTFRERSAVTGKA